MASARSRVRAEQKDRIAQKSVEREQEERYFKNAGVDAGVYRSITDPKEKRNLLTYVNKINRDLMAARNPDLAVNLARANAAKSAGVGDALSFMVLKDPMMELTSQDAGRLNVPAKTARKLAFEQAAYEEKYVNTDAGKKARFRALDIRQKNREYDEEWIKSRPDSRLAIERAAKTLRITNREDKARLLEAERTPGTGLFKERVFRNIRAREETAEATKEYIERNPFSKLARRKRKAKREQRRQAVKRGISGAAHLSRNVLIALVTSVLGAALSGVSLLAKAFAVITDIGQNVRRQVMSDAKLNFDAGTTRGWERFAEKRGFGKDTLVSAAGGILAAWGSPLNYNDGNFNALAPYLRGGIQNLVRMASSGGDKNVLKIMSTVIDDLVGSSLRGVAGTHNYSNDQSGRTAAFAENAGALSAHNAAWGDLMQMYWNDLNDPDSSFKKAAAVKGRDTGFASWVTQGTWNDEYKETGNGVTNMTVQQAAVKTMEAVGSLKGSLNALKNDALERVVGSIGQTVENFRAVVVGLLSRYFPAFAMKEQERAVFLNTQAQADVERNIIGSEAAAKSALRSSGFTGGLTSFKPVFEKLKKGDIRAFDTMTVTKEFIENLTSKDNSVLLGTLANYYNDLEVKERLERENKKIEDGKNAAVVIYDPSSNGTKVSSHVMSSQMTLDRISKTWLPQRHDTSVQAGERVVGVALGAASIPKNFVSQWTQKLSNIGRDFYWGAVRRQREFRDALGKNPADTIGNRRNFRNVEDALYDQLYYGHKAGNREEVVDIFKRLRDFYQEYGHLAKVTDNKDAAALRTQIHSNTEGLLFKNQLRRLSYTFTPSEIVGYINEQLEQYEAVGARDTTLSAREQRQITDNTVGQALSFMQQINTGMRGKGIPDEIYNWLRDNLPGERRSLVVDVDEQALKDGRAAVTNVYLDFGNSKRIHVVSQQNTGVQRDRKVLMSDDVVQALTEAFSATSR
jgi:hypothetical protein